MLEQIDVIDPILLHVIREPIVFNTKPDELLDRGRRTHYLSGHFWLFFKNRSKNEAEIDMRLDPGQTNHRCPRTTQIQ